MIPRPPPPFPYPVTLTLLQFCMVHLLSAAVASPMIVRHIPGMRKPVTGIARNIGWPKLMDMAKLSVFNVVGHALSTVAISRVPVSTVHTIKALTPLFTVMSFHFLFDIHYSFMTYLSLLPLTLGVMMACTSLSFSANDLVGLGTALASTLIFVAQSIYSKNLIGRGEGPSKLLEKEGKLDKVNILYYSSACSVLMMIPMALYYDGSAILFGDRASSSSTYTGNSASLAYICTMIIANGVSQFFQTFLAFTVLALVSPVTYSIASLFKRVFVICFAIIWFGQSVSSLQWCGIVLTFFGLYLYNDSKATKSINKGEEKLRNEEISNSMSLPTVNTHYTNQGQPTSTPSIASSSSSTFVLNSNFESRSHIRKGSMSATQQPITIDTRSLPIVGYRDMSSADINLSPSSARRSSASRRLHQDEVVEFIQAPYYKDPRTALPSPPPSRGSTSDEEDSLASPSRHRLANMKKD